jgi:predicted phosphoribosyltransferase
MIFEDRTEAGDVLAKHLSHLAHRSDTLVLGLPRGGVPVAYEVARELGAPLDIFLVRKLGVPGQEELALGALASGNVRVLNDAVVRELGIPEETIEAITRREQLELQRREHEYRGHRPPLDVRGKIVILIDDGLATGSTMRAAAQALRQMGPARIVVAVPIASAVTCNRIRSEADEVICVNTPEDFFAVGQWYRHFEQTTDGEVRDLLERASGPHQQTA